MHVPDAFVVALEQSGLEVAPLPAAPAFHDDAPATASLDGNIFGLTATTSGDTTATIATANAIGAGAVATAAATTAATAADIAAAAAVVAVAAVAGAATTTATLAAATAAAAAVAAAAALRSIGGTSRTIANAFRRFVLGGGVDALHEQVGRAAPLGLHENGSSVRRKEGLDRSFQVAVEILRPDRNHGGRGVREGGGAVMSEACCCRGASIF